MQRVGPVFLSMFLFLYLAFVPQACSDQTSSTVAPSTDAAAAHGGDGGGATLPADAALEAEINKLINALFPQPEKEQAHQLFAQIKSALDDGDTAAAQDLAFELLDLLFSTELNEPNDLTLPEAKSLFSSLLLEFVGFQLPQALADDIEEIESGEVDGVVAVIKGDEDNTISTPGTDMGGGEIGNTALLVPDGALPDDEDFLLVVKQNDLPCTSTIFEELELCYDYETIPSPAVFSGPAEAKVAVCMEQTTSDPQLIEDSNGTAAGGEAVLPERTLTGLTGFRCDPRGILITSAEPPNALLRLARAIVRPVTHVFDPPPLVAIDGGLAGAIGSIDTDYVGVLPQTIEKVSGDNQTGTPGSTLSSPFVVQVVNAHDGTPVPGVDVTFAVTGGGGALSATTVTTDANGEASTTLTLGSSTGTNTVEASAPQTNTSGDPADPVGSVTFTATAQQLPDLVVSSLTHDPANPTENDNITFTAVVKNLGPGPAGASTLMFKIGGETAGASATLFSVPSLAAGATHTVQRQETLIPQNYINTATADWNDDVGETDETNNTTTDTYTVTSVIQ